MDRLIFNTHDIILLVTIYQCILFALLISIVDHDRHRNDYFLIGFLLTQAAIPMHILVNFGAEFRFVALDFSPNLYRIFEVAYWLEGPLLLWYIRSFVYKDFKLKKWDMLYLLPAALFMIYMVSDFFILSSESKIELLQSTPPEHNSLWVHISGLIREALRVFFSILCLIDIRHSRQQIRDRYSSLEKIDFGWLNLLVIGFTVIRVWAVFVAIAIILSIHINFTVDFEIMGLTGNYTTFLLVSALIFFSLSRSSMFEGVEKSDASPDAVAEVSTELVEKVEGYMESQKPHLANILTLEQLANQIELPPRTLSNVINRSFNQNFFEFVNKYRVAEAQKLLGDSKNASRTMIDIMHECGFNSKATFNTFFKKLVGMTPSQYRSSQLNG